MRDRNPGSGLLIALAAAVFPACQHSDPPNLTRQAAPQSAAERACEHLRALHCPVGDAEECETVFALPPSFGVDTTCVLDASNAADLKRCRVTCE